MKKVLITFVAAVVVLLGAVAVAQTASATKSKKGEDKNVTAASQTATTAKENGESAKTAKIDINSASKDELMTLKGIGDKTADKIIADRPYRSKRDLVTKKIVGQKEYNDIKDQIVAHHAKGASSAAHKGKGSSSSSSTESTPPKQP